MKQPWLFKTHRRMINFRKTPFYFPLTKGDFKFFLSHNSDFKLPFKRGEVPKAFGTEGF